MAKEKTVYVLDTSATGESPVRSHDVFYNGKIERVEFKFGQPTPMPFDLGCKFMLPGFIVKDGDGLDMSAPPVTVDAVKFQIGDDEIVAKYEELTQEALMLRALGRVGGEQFADNHTATRAELITFLKTKSEEVQDEDSVDFGVIATDEIDVSENLSSTADGFSTEDVTDNRETDAGPQGFAGSVSDLNLGSEDISEA